MRELHALHGGFWKQYLQIFLGWYFRHVWATLFLNLLQRWLQGLLGCFLWEGWVGLLCLLEFANFRLCLTSRRPWRKVGPQVLWKLEKKKKQFIVLGNNCCLVTHIACYMKMKILIELTWTFSMEVPLFIKLLIIPLSSRVDWQESGVSNPCCECSLIITPSLE